jgi:hypothetical protein
MAANITYVFRYDTFIYYICEGQKAFQILNLASAELDLIILKVLGTYIRLQTINLLCYPKSIIPSPIILIYKTQKCNRRKKLRNGLKTS